MSKKHAPKTRREAKNRVLEAQNVVRGSHEALGRQQRKERLSGADNRRLAEMKKVSDTFIANIDTNYAKHLTVG